MDFGIGLNLPKGGKFSSEKHRPNLGLEMGNKMHDIKVEVIAFLKYLPVLLELRNVYK